MLCIRNGTYYKYCRKIFSTRQHEQVNSNLLLDTPIIRLLHKLVRSLPSLVEDFILLERESQKMQGWDVANAHLRQIMREFMDLEEQYNVNSTLITEFVSMLHNLLKANRQQHNSFLDDLSIIERKIKEYASLTCIYHR